MWLKRLISPLYKQNVHTQYEEQDIERYFFMVEAFRRGIWPTHCHLATSLHKLKL